MGMQADPTVIYALQKAGKYNGNLSRESLQFDSPYNTYKYTGLPPGPIAAPGRASLQAAAKPADVDSSVFRQQERRHARVCVDLGQHNRNVFRWQVEYSERESSLKSGN